ncbi:hypothetical protein JTE90_007256 [Oedothorax gibbosus]|uniref:Transcription initiation factor TFIID subunit 10 n=1 Tax=Oedothorax gibbosus TaxID=931172 RepID=A0AAV6VMT0_9ARAC|nr:hypothetical protein JTE90_007256 [Oedothorax gibbosus]
MDRQSLVPNQKSTVQSTSSGCTNIEDLVKVLETTSPTIPSAVVQHFINTAGLSTSDPQILNLISLASEKFIADIASEAMEHYKMKASSKGNALLTLTELSAALKEHGINAKKPPYFH